MVNERIGLSHADLIEVRRTAEGYGIEEKPFVQTNKGGVYPFRHPGNSRTSDWTFVLDWHWNRRWIRFHRRSLNQVPAELVIDIEKKKGGNFSVRYEDFEKTLDVCASPAPKSHVS